mmetsp:Transcript_13006/g.14972  ORF Transcript_13006/g.14972 Transcript_13006/m.14972 type:complete len:143 (+) Transcript_13006:203-631(+)
MLKNIDKVYEVLEPLSKTDTFIKSLIDVSKATKGSFHQFGYLGILRTDYMITPEKQAKLVEINTVASGLGSISDKMGGLYKWLINKFYDDQYSAEKLASDSSNIENFVYAFHQAFELYFSCQGGFKKKPILAYMIDYEEANI